MIAKLLKKEFMLLFFNIKRMIVFCLFIILMFLLQWNSTPLYFAVIINVFIFEFEATLSFNKILPVTKKQIFISKLLFLIVIQMFYLVVSVMSAVVSQYLPFVFQKPQLQDVIAQSRLILLVFSFINLIACIAIRRGETLMSALFAVSISIFVVVLAVFGFQQLLEHFGIMLDDGFVSSLTGNIFTVVLAVLYPILTMLGYRLAVNTYVTSDVFDKIK